MTDKLAGAYVQAWVWVEADAFVVPGITTQKQTEDAARATARMLWATDGEIEIDDSAKVSLSHEE